MITILRNPIMRYLSEWKHVQRGARYVDFHILWYIHSLHLFNDYFHLKQLGGKMTVINVQIVMHHANFIKILH